MQATPALHCVQPSKFKVDPAPLQKCVGDFCCINFGGCCWGFSWRIFLGTFSDKNEEKKSGEKKSGEKIRRLMGRPHSADKKFVRARGPQSWNPEVFDQTRCSRILHVEFPLNNRELVKAEVFEKRVFEQTTPFELRK